MQTKNDLALLESKDEMNPLSTGFMVVDTEDNTQGKVYAFDVYTKDGFYPFSTADEMLEFISQRKEKYVFCFNLSYDAFNIFGYDLFKHKPFFIYNRIAKMIYKEKVKSNDTKHYEKIFLDAYNHWNISVESAGEIVGIPKLPVRNYKRKVSLAYRKHDCKIGYMFILKMLTAMANDNIEFKMTIASTSLNNFIKSTGINPSIDKFSQDYFDGYYGGRVSCFRVGKFKKAYKYDINSCYPFVMSKYPYPYPLKAILKPNLKFDGMTCATVQSDLDIPLLPFRNESKELYYPNGVFTGTWCNNELRYFLSIGGKIKKIHSGMHIEQSEFVFKDYMLAMYDKRLQAKDYFSKATIKLLMCSLYGKFAQKSNEFKAIEFSEKNSKLYKGDVFLNKIITSYFRGYPYFSNVIWSAMITAYARCYLHTMLRVLGKDNILYCDTDSIISLVPLSANIIDKTKLGAFKFEGMGKCEIVAPKVYQFKNEIKLKGVPKKAITKGFIQNSYDFVRPVKLMEGIKRGIKPNTWIAQNKTMSYNLKNYTVKNGIVYPKILKGF